MKLGSCPGCSDGGDPVLAVVPGSIKAHGFPRYRVFCRACKFSTGSHETISGAESAWNRRPREELLEAVISWLTGGVIESVTDNLVEGAIDIYQRCRKGEQNCHICPRWFCVDNIRFQEASLVLRFGLDHFRSEKEKVMAGMLETADRILAFVNVHCLDARDMIDEKVRDRIDTLHRQISEYNSLAGGKNGVLGSGESPGPGEGGGG